jgi:hypothetical protein
MFVYLLCLLLLGRLTSGQEPAAQWFTAALAWLDSPSPAGVYILFPIPNMLLEAHELMLRGG